jgi:hypothetical protein
MPRSTRPLRATYLFWKGYHIRWSYELLLLHLWRIASLYPLGFEWSTGLIGSLSFHYHRTHGGNLTGVVEQDVEFPLSSKLYSVRT